MGRIRCTMSVVLLFFEDTEPSDWSSLFDRIGPIIVFATMVLTCCIVRRKRKQRQER